MKSDKNKKSSSAQTKQAAFLVGGVIVAGAVAYWLLRRNVWGMIALKAAGHYIGKAKKPMPKNFGDGTRDAVDQAGWESFPASDPPAYH